MEENKTELKLIQMSEIETEEISWLWFPFIPYGKLTIIQGDPGDGKTTMVLNLAAKLSRGESLDDGMNLFAFLLLRTDLPTRLSRGSKVPERIAQG